MTKAEIQAEIEESKSYLSKHLDFGDTVYTVLRHVSRDGMSRIISLYKLTEDGPINLDYYAARFLGYRIASAGRTGEGLRIRGAGMDMGYHIVYNLSRALFKDDPRRLKPDHDRDAGYILKHRWL